MVAREWLARGCVAAVLTIGVAAVYADVPGFALSGALYTVDGGLTQTPASAYGLQQYESDVNGGTQSAELWEAAAFSWDVTWDGVADVVNYTYTFDINALGTLADSAEWRDLSNFVIALSDDLSIGDGLQNFQYNQGAQDSENPGDWVAFTPNGGVLELQDDPAVDGDATLKFEGAFAFDDAGWVHTTEEGVWQFRFESTQLPMWGSLNLVDGQTTGGTRLTAFTDTYENFVYDNPLGEVSLTQFTDFYDGAGAPDHSLVSYYDEYSNPVYGILVPDTATIADTNIILVPEPGSAALGLLLMLVGLAVRRHHRRA